MGGFLRSLDPFQNPHERCDGIADLNVHKLDLLIQCFLKLRVDQSELFLEILHAHTVLVLRVNGVSQGNNAAPCAGKKDRIEICTAHTYIGSGEAQCGDHLLGL